MPPGQTWLACPRHQSVCCHVGLWRPGIPVSSEPDTSEFESPGRQRQIWFSCNVKSQKKKKTKFSVVSYSRSFQKLKCILSVNYLTIDIEIIFNFYLDLFIYYWTCSHEFALWSCSPWCRVLYVSFSMWGIPYPSFAALHPVSHVGFWLFSRLRGPSMFLEHELLKKLKERFRTAFSLLSKAKSLLELCKWGWRQEDGAQGWPRPTQMEESALLLCLICLCP